VMGLVACSQICFFAASNSGGNGASVCDAIRCHLTTIILAREQTLRFSPYRPRATDGMEFLPIGFWSEGGKRNPADHVRRANGCPGRTRDHRPNSEVSITKRTEGSNSTTSSTDQTLPSSRLQSTPLHETVQPESSGKSASGGSC
jgi:hypothetical protein